MSTSAVKLFIPACGGRPRPAQWPRLCKFALRLDARAAENLWRNLPVTLPLAATTDALRDRILRTLVDDGVAATMQPATVSGEACPIHSAVVADEVCPRCAERRACLLCLRAEEVAICSNCRGKARFFTRFRNVRVAVLLAILFGLLAYNGLTTRRIASWDTPLTIGIYPIVADGTAPVRAYTSSLLAPDFGEVAQFFQREAARYGIRRMPVVELRLGAPMAEMPPEPPPPDASFLAIAKWSLEVRYWSYRVKREHALPSADVEMFVLYRGSLDGHVVDRSVSMEKGRIGIVSATADADDTGWTNLAIVHEVLHTVGATDKYGDDGMPVFPDGFAEPGRSPAFPQTRCEVMAAQVPTAEGRFREPRGLPECVVGAGTAREIGWSGGRE